LSTPEKTEPAKDKKAYHSPVLRHYGAVRAITEAIGNMGNMDGGMGMTSRTA